MPPLTFHLASRFRYPAVLWLALTGATVAGEDKVLTDLRLSGVVLVAGEPKLAVVERRAGQGELVRPGDMLLGIGVVLQIAPAWIRLETSAGPQVIYLESQQGIAGAPRTPATAASDPGIDVYQRIGNDAAGAPSTPAAPEAAEATAEAMPGAMPQAMLEHSRVKGVSVTATPDVLEAISRAAVNPAASETELSRVLIPLLELPGDARVKPFFPGQPEREKKGLGEISAALAQGEQVHLLIEAGGKQEKVYLIPEQPAVTGQDTAP